jgi:hypothetical protein
VLFKGRVDGLVVKIKPEVSTVSPQSSAPDRVTSIDLECKFVALRRLAPSFAIRPSFRLPEDDRSTYGINAALIRAMHRAGVEGHVIACEKQLGERVIFGGFEFLKGVMAFVLRRREKLLDRTIVVPGGKMSGGSLADGLEAAKDRQ